MKFRPKNYQTPFNRKWEGDEYWLDWLEKNTVFRSINPLVKIGNTSQYTIVLDVRFCPKDTTKQLALLVSLNDKKFKVSDCKMNIYHPKNLLYIPPSDFSTAQTIFEENGLSEAILVKLLELKQRQFFYEYTCRWVYKNIKVSADYEDLEISPGKRTYIFRYVLDNKAYLYKIISYMESGKTIYQYVFNRSNYLYDNDFEKTIEPPRFLIYYLSDNILETKVEMKNTNLPLEQEMPTSVCLI